MINEFHTCRARGYRVKHAMVKHIGRKFIRRSLSFQSNCNVGYIQ